MSNLVKNRKIILGGSVILLLFFTSLFYSFYLHKFIPQPPEAVYGPDHRLVDVPPYPPGKHYIMGVDRFGEDVFWKVIDGAKYTLMIAVAVSCMRMGIGIFGGILTVMFLRPFTFFIDSFIRAFRFVPAVMVAYIFFTAVKIDPEIPSQSLIAQQLLILGFIGGIPLSGYLTAEIREFLQNDFIKCSQSLGAGKSWLIKKHIMTFLHPRLIILFTRQVVQSLLILVQLGVFQMVIGKVEELKNSDGISASGSVTLSLSNEWSGLIGLSYRELMLDQWIVLGPSLAFVITIYSFRLIEKGLEERFENGRNRPSPLKKRKETVALSGSPFSFWPEK
ncbi:ABC transporter permease [Lysinibacillus sphaericus]